MGLFEDGGPQPKKVVGRMLKSKPSKDQLLASMVRPKGGADFLSVDVKRKQPKSQETGRIEPAINYISDD
tara:strand:- start:1090 stop:1299 length:210 start_codon:yes stop_codon:yes gene_type:complete